jgi:hypothetical protein
MSRLDDALKIIDYDGGYVPDNVPESKQAIKALMLELIGEDETLTNTTEYDKKSWVEQENNISIGANQLRATLRKKVEEL